MTCNFFLPKGPRTAIGFLWFSLALLFLLSSCQEEEGGPSTDEEEYSFVSTLAGTNAAGFVDGIGELARFNYPSGMAIDADRNLYVSDHSNHSIRKITPDGVVTTFAGTGEAGELDGHRLSATFNNPYGLAIDGGGNLYVSDVSNHRIRKIAPDGTVTTLAGKRQGFSDRKGQLAMFDHPYGVAVDKSGNVYVADSYNNRIRMITPDGSTSTLAGNGNDGFVDGLSSDAEFYVPIGIAIDQQGNLYVGDEGNSSVRKITPDGRVATLAGSGKFSFADGVGKNAVFNAPGAIAIDSHNNLFVADYLNNCIRKVSPEGEVRKIAGSREKGFADGSPSEAEFYYPFGIAVDGNGVVYVADQFNHRIRKID
jgi:sugar lactone lactonase YvrE